MNSHHHFLTAAHLGPGPSHQPPAPQVSSQLKCPECHQTFSEVVSLYAHAAHTHYWNILASLFVSDFLLVNGKCAVCPKSQKLKSVNAFIKHMGGKHRIIHKFMTPELLHEYSKLPTTEAEYQDVQALLEMADQPDRNLLKKVREKEREFKKTPELPQNPYGSVAFPQVGFPTDMSAHFLANASQLSNSFPVAQQEQDLRRLTKKGRIRKTMPHDPIKCPECECTFEHVSSLYNHAAGKHYYAQLVELHKGNFMKTDDGMCSSCPNRALNDVQSYVLHIGAKHKMIHQFIAPEMLLEYGKLPCKRVNSSYTPVKNASLINCVICGVNAKRKFANVTEYKQHLSIFHFRNQISTTYLHAYAHSSSEMNCSICAASNQDPGRTYKSTYALIVHLGSKHNVILDFADEPLRVQLHSFNVFKN